MPDDQNTSQNPTPEENSIPVSPQEPTADAPILPIDSEPAEALLEVPEDPGDGFSAKSDNIPPSNSTLTEPSNEPKPEEKSAQNEPSIELQPEAGQSTAEVSNPVKVIEPSATTPADEVKADKPTAQISTNEPLKSKPEEKPSSPAPAMADKSASSEPKPRNSTPTEATSPVASSSNHMRELQVKEQLAIKNKKQKKLDLLMTLFLKKPASPAGRSKNGSTNSTDSLQASSPQVTNDEVEKFLHVSDATATRYLSQLEKEGKIKQNGKTGKWVSYSRI